MLEKQADTAGLHTRPPHLDVRSNMFRASREHRNLVMPITQHDNCVWYFKSFAVLHPVGIDTMLRGIPIIHFSIKIACKNRSESAESDFKQTEAE